MPLFVNKSSEDIPSQLNVDTDMTSWPIEDTPSVRPIEDTPDVLNEDTTLYQMKIPVLPVDRKQRRFAPQRLGLRLGG